MKGIFTATLVYQFENGDIILNNNEDGSCMVKTSEFVTNYSKSEMKKIYNYPSMSNEEIEKLNPKK